MAHTWAMTERLPSVPQMANRALYEHHRALSRLAAGRCPEASRQIMSTLRRWQVIEGETTREAWPRLTERGRELLATLDRRAYGYRLPR